MLAAMETYSLEISHVSATDHVPAIRAIVGQRPLTFEHVNVPRWSEALALKVSINYGEQNGAMAADLVKLLGLPGVRVEAKKEVTQ